MITESRRDYVLSHIRLFLKDTSTDYQSVIGYHHAYVALQTLLRGINTAHGFTAGNVFTDLQRYYKDACPQNRKIVLDRLIQMERVFQYHYLIPKQFPNRWETLDFLCELYAKRWNEPLRNYISDFNSISCNSIDLLPAILDRPLDSNRLSLIQTYWLEFFRNPEKYAYSDLVTYINKFLCEKGDSTC